MSKQNQAIQEDKDYIVKDLSTFERKLKEVREAQNIFASFSQEKVDHIFREAALAANHKKDRPSYNGKQRDWNGYS